MSISDQAIQARNLTREMPDSERPISEQYRIVAKRWVEADAVARLLEDTRQSIFSQLVLKQTDIAISRAEHTARASAEYMEHITRTNTAKEKANLLRVQMKYLEMRFSEWQSDEANQRKERSMGRQAT